MWPIRGSLLNNQCLRAGQTLINYLISVMQFFIYLALIVILGNGALWADDESAKAFADDRPNIIFFLTDDQRNDFLGCTGHPIIKTPNITGFG